MDLAQLNDQQLLTLREHLQILHTGSADKTFNIGDKAEGDKTDGVRMYGVCGAPHLGWMNVAIKDKRLNDLLFVLFCETHNELCTRFAHRIPTENLA